MTILPFLFSKCVPQGLVLMWLKTISSYYGCVTSELGFIYTFWFTILYNIEYLKQLERHQFDCCAFGLLFEFCTAVTIKTCWIVQFHIISKTLFWNDCSKTLQFLRILLIQKPCNWCQYFIVNLSSFSTGSNQMHSKIA